MRRILGRGTWSKDSERPARRGGVSAPERPRLSHEEVARRAYERYLARGCGHGKDLEDWLEAEKECRNSFCGS